MFNATTFMQYLPFITQSSMDTDLCLYKQCKDQEKSPHIIRFACILIIFSENTYKTKMF